MFLKVRLENAINFKGIADMLIFVVILHKYFEHT